MPAVVGGGWLGLGCSYPQTAASCTNVTAWVIGWDFLSGEPTELIFGRNGWVMTKKKPVKDEQPLDKTHPKKLQAGLYP